MKHHIIACALALLLAAPLCAPAAAQETSGNFAGGSVAVGYDNRTCNSGLSGAIRFNSSTSCTEFCDGTSWSCPAGVKTSSCNISVTSGLISRWTFDEKTGNILHDIHGGHHANITTNATWQPTGGRIGGAAQFTGAADEYPVTSNHPGLLGLDQFSICMWFNTPGNATDLFFSNFGRWRGVGFSDAASDDIYAFITTTGTAIQAGSNGVYTTNAWNHMCVTWNGGLTGSTAIQFYRNGASVTKSYSQTGTGDATATDDGLMGMVSQSNFVGYIDDTLLYNRALTSGEVTTIYNNYTACP